MAEAATAGAVTAEAAMVVVRGAVVMAAETG